MLNDVRSYTLLAQESHEMQVHYQFSANVFCFKSFKKITNFAFKSFYLFISTICRISWKETWKFLKHQIKVLIAIILLTIFILKIVQYLNNSSIITIVITSAQICSSTSCFWNRNFIAIFGSKHVHWNHVNCKSVIYFEDIWVFITSWQSFGLAGVLSCSTSIWCNCAVILQLSVLQIYVI